MGGTDADPNHTPRGFDYIQNLIMTKYDGSNVEEIKKALEDYGFDPIYEDTCVAGYVLDHDGYIRESYLDLDLCLDVVDTYNDATAPESKHLTKVELRVMDKLPVEENLEDRLKQTGTRLYVQTLPKGTVDSRKKLWFTQKAGEGQAGLSSSLFLPDHIRRHPRGRIEFAYSPSTYFANERLQRLGPPPESYLKKWKPSNAHRGTGRDGAYTLADAARDFKLAAEEAYARAHPKVLSQEEKDKKTNDSIYWDDDLYMDNGRFYRKGGVQDLRPGQQRVVGRRGG